MKKSWNKYMNIGTIHFMSFPEVMGGEGPITETLEKILANDFFTAVELTRIKDEKVREQAKEMRVYNMISLCASGSGHTGGTLSIMDIAAVLYLKVINHDPANPKWDDRDRVFWSVGHKAPALYVALGMAGYFPVEDTVKLRKLWSGFEGHPNQFKLPGLELSSGSLGQGLGVAVGSALRAKLDNKNYRVFCIMGDGEQQEGSVWEAVMSAGHYKLDNLVGINDHFGESGAPWDLMKAFGLSAEQIAVRAKKMFDLT